MIKSLWPRLLAALLVLACLAPVSGSAYYYRGRYYRYRYHGSYYPYHYHGSYYRHRVWVGGHAYYRYW